MPRPLYIFFEFEIWVSWVIAIPFFLSAMFRWPSSFNNGWRSKLIWMGVTLLGVIPFVGFILALIYYFRVYRYFPPKDHPIIEGALSGARRPVSSNRPGSARTASNTGNAQRNASGSTMSWQPTAPQRCGGNCQNGTVPCYGCSNGTVYEGTRAVHHNVCNGTGRRTCQMCNGSGHR